MKVFAFVLPLVLISAGFAFTAELALAEVNPAQTALVTLDGGTYCRTLQTGGMFGQPRGERQHCVSFNAGVATDNANTFFGNPPESFNYSISGVQVMNDDEGAPSPYDIDVDHLVYRGTNAILTLQ